ncbi:UV-damaged DNA-binding protein rad7 [Podospora bellae-mahoneyi]|uniref:UV-damaged DNA-binding protein rad7 n=1 Tax=Podospora bellae-mahoneyi TaxID=2093777 RepID=A0ABR0FUL2_9PEZI|nr:UV-damaged DNA-binding protein rad7 [Podospora bellae-mahoneyi]
MSRQTRTVGRRIMGPQSALTDFLASHNISANQIRLDAEARRRAAAQDNQEGQADAAQQQLLNENGDFDTLSPESDEDEPVVASTGRVTRGRSAAQATSEVERRKKEKEKHAIDKIKASKKSQKRKRDPDASDDDDDDIVRALFNERAKPLPGQMENCAICNTRFTVTPYSRNAPDGGLVCSPCGKELTKDDPAPKKKTKRASGGPVGARRQTQSRILDGTYHVGGKSLMSLCIQTLAKNIDLAEDLGDLPPKIVDKIARKLSKHRLLNPTTLSLFLKPSNQGVLVYDGAKLSADDFYRIFHSVPELKKLKVRNAIHFKDEVVEYIVDRHIVLEDLYLHGCNLISEGKWIEYLQKKGQPLRSLRVYWTDKHFTDAVLAVIPTSCPNLTRLKVCHNQAVTGEGLNHIAKIATLRHLSLDLREAIHPDVYVKLLTAIGPQLETLCLTRVPELDNTVLDALHMHCRNLKKLRITDSELMTDAGFARLFTSTWSNPGLVFLDLQKCRQLESTKPRENPDGIGLCDEGFKALMAHSGKMLQNLNVHGCRHISSKAFEEVFTADKTYENMHKMEISFCEEVTDFVVGCIFRSCPNLRELNVFGCMKVKDVRVPKGKILVGVPNARGMVIEGED